MLLKSQYKKINSVLSAVLILGLLLISTPWQAQAAINVVGNYSCDPDKNQCYSCDAEGNCVRDNSGPYSCSKCNGQCSAPVSSASSGCGSAPITGGTVDVYIVGSAEQSAAEVAAQEGINTLEDLANVTGLIDEAKQSLIDLINQNKPIPEDLKEFIINAIKNSAEIPSATKETLINLIKQNMPIPDELKGAMITMIENLKDTIGLIKNKFLDLIFSGMNIQWICQQLSNAATALPWGIGAVIAQAIAMACPVLLNNFLTELGFYEEKLKTGASIQTIPVPTFRYYEWEVGIPGFIKPGQKIKFK